jgi:hypothetical protein
VAGVSAGALGLATLTAGVVCTVIAERKLAGLESDAANDRPYDEDNGNWRAYRSASVVLYVAGGAAIVGGATAYLLGRQPETRDQVTSVSLIPTMNGTLAAYARRF